MASADARARLWAFNRDRAVRLLQSARWRREHIAGLEKLLREDERALHEIAVVAFNRESEPINGVVVDDDGVELGDDEACEASPITVHVYAKRSDEAMSIPGSRAMAAWSEAHKGTPDEFRWPDEPSMSTDACLFCGVRSGRDGPLGPARRSR